MFGLLGVVVGVGYDSGCDYVTVTSQRPPDVFRFPLST